MDKYDKGFTLIELLISMCILFLFWGSVVGLFARMELRVRNALAPDVINQAILIQNLLERDINQITGFHHGDHEKLEWVKTPGFKEVSYEYDGNSLFRREDGRKTQVLNHVSGCRWLYLNKGTWMKEWDEDSIPAAILCELMIHDKVFRFVCPTRIES